MAKNSIKPMSIAAQAALLKRMFPGSTMHMLHDNELIWRHKIKPSPLSAEYSVKLHYKMDIKKKSKNDRRVNFYVTDPMPLALAKSAKRLPHVYDQKTQKLCLYYPDGKEWKSTMALANTIVLWGYEWLYHYELWLGTDNEWRGGGVHPPSNQTKIEDIIKRNQTNK